MTGISILGSTGSIGMSTLDVIAEQRDRFQVVALTANTQVDRLFQQCKTFEPEFAVMVDADAAQQLQKKVKQAGLKTKIRQGLDGLIEIVRLPQTDQVMAAIVGAAGLLPTLAAAEAGKRVLLANKEALVMSGQLFMDAVKKNGAELLPIDSEHNAIFQCLPDNYQAGFKKLGIRKILLTGSGGPFRNTPLAELNTVTPDQACAHPNWSMGRKISVDSATMMNKGLELIEACWLFNTTPDNIKIVVHPQSIIHSMVEYVDGSVLSQMGMPDMRTPIAHAMAWPQRMSSGVERLDFLSGIQLDFEKPDYVRFPCLRLSEEAIRTGGTMPAILNAANEVAVQAFLDEKLAFTAIAGLVEQVMENISSSAAMSLDVILKNDAEARKVANSLVGRK
ncbi:1-deoxy-D-xylulose 5-phosphate reductoisomerase [hydrothermal vent metagenome]|uniref:1-deoxy-D-xylulose-5-phosphate reductoisomerase n=1 Tax=hydrothermal vent metagenome TaxID=652676 RepID=A0A3B1BPK6_9ZZZZ